MGVIFPLSWPGKIALVLIAITLFLIWWSMKNPTRFARVMGRFSKDNQDKNQGNK